MTSIATSHIFSKILTLLHHCYVKVMSLYYVTSQCILELLGAFFKNTIMVFNGEQKRIHYLCEDEIENLNLTINVCHHSSRLMMPNSGHRDRFFYHTLTLMIDSYNMYIIYFRL